MIMISTIG